MKYPKHPSLHKITGAFVQVFSSVLLFLGGTMTDHADARDACKQFHDRGKAIFSAPDFVFPQNYDEFTHVYGYADKYGGWDIDCSGYKHDVYTEALNEWAWRYDADPQGWFEQSLRALAGPWQADGFGLLSRYVFERVNGGVPVGQSIIHGVDGSFVGGALDFDRLEGIDNMDVIRHFLGALAKLDEATLVELVVGMASNVGNICDSDGVRQAGIREKRNLIKTQYFTFDLVAYCKMKFSDECGRKIESRLADLGFLNVCPIN